MIWWASGFGSGFEGSQVGSFSFFSRCAIRYHTSKATRAFFEAHAARLTVFQLPSYSPDYNPIDFLWKNVKRRSTHNQYLPEFESLVASVNEGLTHFGGQRQAIKNLMGRYVDSLADLPAAA